MVEEKRQITIIDGKGYIFDLDTLKHSRETHHIAGVLAGVLPQFPQQNIFGGLPLQLLPEEVKFLLDSGEYELKDGTSLHGAHQVHSIDWLNNEHAIIPITSTYKKLDSKARPAWIEPLEERYNIFRFLVQRGYFIMPGLRFGCQFMAYPGDLMRYHSHFNVNGYQWNQKLNVLDIVNGGRLATSVKKCWVVGAQDPETEEMEVFSIEWAQFG